MCLAVPALVMEINHMDGKVKIGEIVRSVRFDLLDEVSAGDYVLIHAGYAIERLEEEDALTQIDEVKKYAEQ